MNLRNDMLDMQCGPRRVVLTQLTIFAGILARSRTCALVLAPTINGLA
jgi:hypothetical protein